MQAEQPPTLDKKAHLVLAVGVFGQKLLPQAGPIGVVRRQPDRIHRGVGARCLHSGNLGAIGSQNRLLVGLGRQIHRRRPALETDAAAGQLRLDLAGIRRAPGRGWRLARRGMDQKQAHGGGGEGGDRG